MAFLHGFFDGLPLSGQLGLHGVLVRLQLVLGLLQVFNLLTTIFLVLLARLGELLQRLLLALQLVREVLNALARQLHLLLHAIVVLKRGAKLGEPELLQFVERQIELLDFACLGPHVTVLFLKLGLRFFAPEMADKLKDVRADLLRVSDAIVPLLCRLEAVTFGLVHMN